MASLSVGDAVGAGFKLIGQRPVSVFVWGLFTIVFGVLPALGMVSSMMGPMMDMVQNAKLHPDAPPPQDMFRHSYAHMMFMNPLVQLLSAAVKTMVAAAVFRAVLEPNRKAFAYLRISMQEVWVLLVKIVKGIVVGAGAIAAFLVGALVVVAIGHFASHMAAGIAACVLVIVGVIGLFWVLLRLSLATPMSFEERNFRLFESWKVTRGHSLSLLLIAILLGIILLLLEGVAFAVIGVPMMMFVHPHMAADHMAAHEAILTFLKQPPQVMLQTAGPLAAVGVLIGSVVIGALSAIVYAPWAAAYRMLKPAS